jgi:hypothetical protein
MQEKFPSEVTTPSPRKYSGSRSWIVNSRNIVMSRTMPSNVLISGTWFIFTQEVDIYTAEYVAFTIR